MIWLRKMEQWGFNIPDLEAMFPAGTVDQTAKRVYKEVSENLSVYICAYMNVE